MPPVAETVELEREYVAHRSAVMAMLRAEFGGVPDHEELYQEAWAELLELRARGEHPKSFRGLLKTIAWRRARDRLRKLKPETLDPTSPALTLQADADPLPDEQAQVHLDAVVLRQVIDRLEPRQAAALKLRFDWHLDSREIQERLGVSAKRLEKIVTEAYKCVAAELEETGRESRWTRRQRSLLLACEMGLASAGQRERAQKMVDEDPACRAMLREMRTRLTDVAVAAPVPVLFESRLPDPIPVFDRLGDAWASAKQSIASLVGRGPGNASSLEQATGAGGALIGGGAATKAVVACLAASGGAVLCVETGVLQSPPEPRREARQRTVPQTAPPRSERSTAVPTPTAETEQKPKKPKKASAPKRKSEVPTSSPKAEPDPSPAPEGSTEFGPGAIGSAPAPSTPAAAPTDGGGEFGP